MEHCRECAGALVLTESDYVCTQCGLVCKIPVFLPCYDTDYTVPRCEESCTVIEAMVYSLGFEEGKVEEVNLVYKTYKDSVDLTRVHNQCEVVCAILVFVTKQSNFLLYCNHFGLLAKKVSAHLQKVRKLYPESSRQEAIFEIVRSLCATFNLPLDTFPAISAELCDLPHSETVVAGALVCKFAAGKVKQKCVSRELTVSTTALSTCMKRLNSLNAPNIVP